MSRFVVTSLICAGLCVSIPSFASAAFQPTAVEPAAASKDATTFAGLTIPYDIFLQSNLEGFLFGFNETVKNDPQAIALFEAYPGVREAIVKAQLESLRTLMAREHVVLMDLIGRHNDRSYTPAELVKLNAFFSSAIGKKLIASEFKTVDKSKLLEALSGDDRTLTAKETTDLTKNAPLEIFNSLTNAEQVEAARFWGSMLGQKVNGNSPKLVEITRNWLNDLNGVKEKNAEALSVEVVREFMAKSEAAKAGKTTS